MSSAPVPCSTQVAGASTLGAASLEGDVLVWRPAADGVNGTDGVPRRSSPGTSGAKPGAARASLRLVLGEPKPGAKPTALVLQFAAEGDRDALSDAVKARASPRPADPATRTGSRHRTLRGGTRARAALLQSNPELAALHGQLLVRGPPRLRLRRGPRRTPRTPPPPRR